MNDKTKQLLERTFNFGVNVLKYLAKLPSNHIYDVPIRQLARSSTAIGANYEEAQAAESKKDFSHKIGISSKEARESCYWLRILKAIYTEQIYQDKLGIFLKETEEFKKIFSSIKKSSEE